MPKMILKWMVMPLAERETQEAECAWGRWVVTSEVTGLAVESWRVSRCLWLCYAAWCVLAPRQRCALAITCWSQPQSWLTHPDLCNTPLSIRLSGLSSSGSIFVLTSPCRLVRTGIVFHSTWAFFHVILFFLLLCWIEPPWITPCLEWWGKMASTLKNKQMNLPVGNWLQPIWLLIVIWGVCVCVCVCVCV